MICGVCFMAMTIRILVRYLLLISHTTVSVCLRLENAKKMSYYMQQPLLFMLPEDFYEGKYFATDDE